MTYNQKMTKSPMSETKAEDLFDLPFWEHVSELRKMILKSLLVMTFGMICALFFYQEMFTFLTSPLEHVQNSSHLVLREVHKERLFNSGLTSTLFAFSDSTYSLLSHSADVQLINSHTFLIPQNGYIEYERLIPVSEKMKLMLFGPLDGMGIALKMGFWVGLVATSPIWLFFMLQYVAPALRMQERRLLFPFLLLSLGFISAGLLLAFFVTIPIANQYLLAFNSSLGINMWSLLHYFDYTLMLLLANALAFECGVVLIFLVHFGILTEKTLRTNRRFAIVAAFIIAAILTPPDVLTQFMLAIPLIALYESAILYAKFRLQLLT